MHGTGRENLVVTVEMQSHEHSINVFRLISVRIHVWKGRRERPA